MKKIYFLCLVLISLTLRVKADHIAGGEMFYTYVSNANGTFTYNVTFKLYKKCFSESEIKNPTIVSIFEKGTNRRIADISVRHSSIDNLVLNNTDPCIIDPPEICFQAINYTFTVTLPVSDSGYILATEANYRIDGFANLLVSSPGATFTAEIPATPFARNTSARFNDKDLVVVCANNKFSYDFGATDPDGDELRYSFCTAYDSRSAGNDNVPVDTTAFLPVQYGHGFDAGSPLGMNAHIDEETGIITGVAPDAGFYLIAVCIQEIRNGKIIATQRKDIQLNVASCTVVSATLLPEYLLCKNSKSVHLVNLSPSPLINTWSWTLSNIDGSVIYQSSQDSIDYTFTDTGVYKIKLVINRGEKCEDSAISFARVYTGLIADFSFAGSCFTKPFIFSDKTTSAYGEINGWYWFFGTGDTSSEQNPAYTYSSSGTNRVQLIVTNTMGCIDTVIKSITVLNAPSITLEFRDTLICKGDAVTLRAEGKGSFNWTPPLYIDTISTATPVVSPPSTTVYKVKLDNDGCTNFDSVMVRVADHVDLIVMNDTTVCSGDTVRLTTNSNALNYSWFPAAQCIDAFLQNPLVVTNNTTTYRVTARIGGCVKTGDILVKAVAYPSVFAGPDRIICYNTSTQLNANVSGNFFKWSPVLGLDNAGKLNPVASPPYTTSYVLSVSDTLGCPKISADTVTITVLPLLKAFAGKDTSVFIGESLQLNAAGGSSYLWTPATGLSSTNLANPVAIYYQPTDGIQYKVIVSNEANCRDSDYITVRVFNNNEPVIFVPSAFTPNGDGLNDFIRPITVGIKQIIAFNIYNRWGKLVFTTNTTNEGWDGKIKGINQPDGGVYVWQVKAIDYKGGAYFKKGTLVLLR